ncbi:MAG: hypothetical protein WDM87_07530 [Terracidiphilus sp.]
MQHTPGGPKPYKDAEEEVEQAYYMSLMDPAIRDYLNQMRDQGLHPDQAGICRRRRYAIGITFQHQLQRL